MIQVSRSDFEAELRRWFLADDLPVDEVDRLYAAWQERAKDWPYINWLEDQFDPQNRAAYGRAWWEERQQGKSHYAALPITEIDYAKMWLSKDPLARSPRARRWCPDILAGRWTLVASRDERRDDWTPPTTPRELVLHDDGLLDLDGDPEYRGWWWAAHRSGTSLYLYVVRPGQPMTLPDWNVYVRDSGEMDIYAAEQRPHSHLRWRRVT